MLRCLKWLPIASLLTFLLCLGLGWAIGRPPAKHDIEVQYKDRPIHDTPKMMTLIFLAYNRSGQQVPIKVFINGVNVNVGNIPKQTFEVSPTPHSVRIVPEDISRYQERTEIVTWRNKEEFSHWLDTDCLLVLQNRGVNITPLQPALSQIKGSIAVTSCNYPIILDNKKPDNNK